MQVVEWSAKQSVSGVQALMGAENHARKNQAGVWAGGAQGAQRTVSQAQPVVVAEVRSGDTLFVLPVNSTGEPVQVQEAHILVVV